MNTFQKTLRKVIFYVFNINLKERNMVAIRDEVFKDDVK